LESSDTVFAEISRNTLVDFISSYRVGEVPKLHVARPARLNQPGDQGQNECTSTRGWLEQPDLQEILRQGKLG
jgi:hypothetical protein